jgi:hypothetical protein
MTSKRIAALRAKTVARGATEAEAAAAATKVSELMKSEQREEATACLQRLGWGEAQAQGIVAGLDRLPPWQTETDWRWPLLWVWASAHQKQDPLALKTQLRFLTEDLANALKAIGVAIRAAKTEEEATKAFKPYADQLAR